MTGAHGETVVGRRPPAGKPFACDQRRVADEQLEIGNVLLGRAFDESGHAARWRGGKAGTEENRLQHAERETIKAELRRNVRLRFTRIGKTDRRVILKIL